MIARRRSYHQAMTAEHFDRTLPAYQRRKPFRPFRVQLVSGEHVDVDHPEAIVIRGGVAVSISPGGAPTLFESGGR